MRSQANLAPSYIAHAPSRRRLRRLAGVIVSAVCLSLTAVASVGQQPAASSHRTIAAMRTAAAPTIDGDLSDEAWKSAAKAETFFDQLQDAPVQDQTTALLLYDDRYIYVGFYCRDGNPGRISARETALDSKFAGGTGSVIETEDNVEIMLDPFNSRKAADISHFSVNAIGTRSARLGGGRGAKREWTGEWDAIVRRLVDGWSVEMRIPWRILNYPTSKQPLTLGVNFSRFQFRTTTISFGSNIGRDLFFEKEGQWTGVQPPAVLFRSSLSLLPYILPGIGQDRPTFRTGMDARYTISPQLTAVGSANPDFATIEGAVDSIQVCHDERTIPERRPFFLEGSDLFQSNSRYHPVTTLFYPLRIPTFDLGAKLYGKLTSTDTLGLLATIDIHNRADLVARYRHDFSPTSQTGLLLIQKTALDDDNTVAVLDHRERLGKLEVYSQYGVTRGREAGGSTKLLDLIYEDGKVTEYAQWTDVDANFRDADGIVQLPGAKGPNFLLDYSPEWKHGFFRSFYLTPTYLYLWHPDGLPYYRRLRIASGVSTQGNDWSLDLLPEYGSRSERVLPLTRPTIS